MAPAKKAKTITDELIKPGLYLATPFGGGFGSSFAAVPDGEATAEGVIGDFAPTGRYRP